MHVTLHFAEGTFALHLLFQRFQRLVDIIVAHENLNDDQVLQSVPGISVTTQAQGLRVGNWQIFIPCPKDSPSCLAVAIPEVGKSVYQSRPARSEILARTGRILAKLMYVDLRASHTQSIGVMMPDPKPSLPNAEDWAVLTEQAVLDQALDLAKTRGWSDQLAWQAGQKAGLSRAETELLLPHGAADLAALLSRRHDATTLATLEGLNPSALKIRARIQTGIELRLSQAVAEGQAAHAWAGYLALPHHAPLALRLVWQSADMIWRWAGDTATDENHYSKRALVGAILMAGLTAHLASGEAAAKALISARIDNVMAFETWKHKARPVERLQTMATSLAARLGQIRYGAKA